jgi:hypothetical protein
VLLEELATGQRLLTPELVESEPFLHACMAVARAAAHTRRAEKIRLLGRVLLGAVEQDALETDTYDEFAALVEALSWRELHVLAILQRYEDSVPEGPPLQPGQRAAAFWPRFEATVQGEVAPAPSVLRDMLTGLNRTGLYESFTGAIIGYTGGRGMLTTRYRQLAAWLRRHAESPPGCP